MSPTPTDATNATQLATELAKLATALVLFGVAVVPILLNRKSKRAKKKALPQATNSTFWQKAELYTTPTGLAVICIGLVMFIADGFGITGLFFGGGAVLFGISYLGSERPIGRFLILMITFYSAACVFCFVIALAAWVLNSQDVERAKMEHRIHMILYREKWGKPYPPNSN